MIELSAAEARRAVVNAHFAPVAADALDVLRNERLLQLDGISRVDKAHRLAASARLPARRPAAAYDEALWNADEAVSFETFTDVACLFPIEDWPLFDLSRQWFRDHFAAKGSTPPPELKHDILRIVAGTEGGATIGDIEDGGPRGGSWGWSERQKAAEFMLWCGELVCTRRTGIKRLFDLPESRVPTHLFEARPHREEVLAGLVASALRALGVATVPDLRRHYRLSAKDVHTGLEGAGAVVVRVQGWGEDAYALGEPDIAPIATTETRGSRLIGPFDNLLRNRKRAARIFGYEYLFEAYVPKTKRQYGAYVMSVLHGDRFVGRADAQRTGRDVNLWRVFGEDGVPARSVRAAARRGGMHLARQLGGELRMETE
ncbi:DNA glycosylase AlkZ-like family protein [Zhihengliuella halotolerans]|uniref:DNA glycosylase AlkZ-like family protein n=1 Tax=Zhihengliuella halotolerans TaxID=370736 RepID=UPI000C808995|nr:crosslink repair DNA glycosylase YcaQ family protein [Zhihengliuella halotolerans]